MPIVTLNPTAIRRYEDASPFASEPFSAGRNDSWQTVVSGVSFSLPSDILFATITSAKLLCDAIVYIPYGGNFRTRLGTPSLPTSLANHPTPPNLVQSALRHLAHVDYPFYSSNTVDHFITNTGTTAIEINVAAMLQAAFDVETPTSDFQIWHVLSDVPYDPYSAIENRLTNLRLELNYTTSPLSISTPVSMRVGQSFVYATLRRSVALPDPLVVSLSTSPSGILSVASTVTISGGSSTADFELTGLSGGVATITATAGSDSASKSLTILSSLPAGIGDEVGWWCPSLDSDANGTTGIYDLSGNDNHGSFESLSSSAWETDTTSGGVRCLNFGTTAGRVNFGHKSEFDFDRTDSFSVTAWMFSASGSSTNGPILSKLINDGTFRGYELAVHVGAGNGLICFLISTNPSSRADARIPNSVFDLRGAWRHVGFTYDGSSSTSGIKLYINGIERTPKTSDYNNLTTTLKNTHPLALGSRNGTENYTGKIDDVRMYSRVLSAAEMVHLASARGVLGPPASDLLLDLVSYWKLDESSGTALDYVGSNHLTAYGGPGTASGKISGARDFNGSNQYFAIPSNASLSTGDIDFTFSAWIRPTAGSSNRRIICKINGAVTQLEYQIFYKNDAFTFQKVVFEIFNGGSVVGVVNSASLTNNQWYHLVCFHNAGDNSVGMIINNDTPITAATTGAPAIDSLAPFCIGSLDTLAGTRWQGQIDEVGFWKRVLSASEITNLYNSGSGLAFSQLLPPVLGIHPAILYHNRQMMGSH